MVWKKISTWPPKELLAAVFLASAAPFLAASLFLPRPSPVMNIDSYLVFHNVAEFFSVIVSLSIFGAAWYTYEQSQDRHALFLGAAFLAVGIIDFMHTLSYAGMPAFITPNSANKSTQFWIIARLIAAGAFVLSARIYPGTESRLLSKPVLLSTVLGIVTLAFAMIVFFPALAPLTFQEGSGLTPFKKVSEYIAIALLSLAAAAYWLRFQQSKDALLLYYTAAFIVCVFSELMFALYQSVFDINNVMGHVYKVAAFYLIYKGIFTAAVAKPYTRLIDAGEKLRIDIAERKRIEEALRASEERYRLIAENVTDVIWTFDLKTKKMTYISPSVKRLRGYAPEEVMTQTLDELLTPDSMEQATKQLEENIARALAGDTSMNGMTAEVEQPRKNGSTVWTEATINLIRDQSGSLSYLFGVSRDITERKRAEEALLDSEKRYRHLVESVTDYIYTVRVENGRPAETTHSPGCLAVTGYRPEDYASEPLLWHRMIHEEDREAVSEQAERILSGEPVSSFEHRILHKDGSVRWVKHTPVPRYDEKGVLIAWDGLISDITERKRLEEQLRQAQKMEAIGQLAGGIAHDFNNILSAIIGYGTLLQMKTEKEDRLRANIDSILNAADRAANLTHSLLAFSRNQLLKTEPVDLNDIVRHIESLLCRIIGEDIELQTKLEKEPVIINADRGQIEQALMNLATNARDAMSRGGTFAIETDTMELNELPEQSPGTLKPGSYAVLSVSDTGTGMDGETQKKVFEPFFSTKEQGKGTGLGLSMVYGIVQQHNGSITLWSEPGKGTLFKIFIPLVSTKETAGSLSTDPQEAAPRGTETVLVAEDDDAIREISQNVLTESGYRVIEARNGEEAVEQFRKYKDSIKMVLLDMIMPKMSGREAYEEIRKIGGDVKVVFVSGYTADKTRSGGALPGKAVLLNKPVLPRQLLKKIRDVLDS